LNASGKWRFASLGSGSRGNGTLISRGHTEENDASCFLIDCGFSLKQSQLRLERLGVSPESLTAILVTHEHSDHIQGVIPLAKKYNVPVFCSHGTSRASHRRGHRQGQEKDSSLRKNADIVLSIVEGEKRIEIGGVWVQPVSVPHDAREPLQFIIGDDSVSIGVLTDIGHITPHVVNSYSACDALLVESNHDLQMLENSNYPGHLIQRVSGLRGHLSNDQTAEFLENVLHPKLQHVVIGHMSEQNNTRDCVESAFAGIKSKLGNLTYASQQEGTGWIEVHPPSSA